MKIRYLTTCILILLFTSSCTKDDVGIDNNSNQKEVLYEWELASGNGNPNNYNIGFVFEAKDNNASKKTYLDLLERMVGSGDFSLFKTIPFNNNKEKFNIYYAVLSKSDDKNELPYSENELSLIRSKADDYFIKNKEQFIHTDDILNFAQNMATAVGYDISKVEKSFFYLDDSALEDGDLSPQKSEIVARNIRRFGKLFNQKKLDTQVYISEGINSFYADIAEKPKRIYIGNYDRTLFDLVKAELVHPDQLAGILTHEFGHAFALFTDEYYPIDTTFPNINKDAFTNNTVNIGFTYNKIIFDPKEEKTNPWMADEIPVLVQERKNTGEGQNEYDFIRGPIPSYKGTLIEGGNGSYGAYRNSDNSIMRFPLKLTQSDWENGWSPVQQFYINYFISKI